MKRCKTCRKRIIKYFDRKSFHPSKRRASDNTHFHHGTTYDRYGKCDKNHLTKIRKVKVIWDPCLKCKFKGEINSMKRSVSTNDIESIKIEMKELKAEMRKQSKKLNELKKTPTCPDLLTEEHMDEFCKQLKPIEETKEIPVTITTDKQSHAQHLQKKYGKFKRVICQTVTFT